MAPQTGLAKSKEWRLRWFSDEDTPEERRFITKLDLILVPYIFVSYWIKGIDQYNLNNAYVAGMKEELGFYGNQLIRLQTMYIIGAVLGQIPFLFLFTYVPMHWLVPGMDVMWGLCTLLQFRAHSFAEIAAYRFLVGWFEAAYFPAIHYILGSWYRGHEISRRGGIWYTAMPLGILTAGLFQAATTTGLQGVDGLSGWRWMYIICAVVTIPVGVCGYFILPGTVAQPNLRILSEAEVLIARHRLDRDGHSMQGKLRVRQIRHIMSSKLFWILVLVCAMFWNGVINQSAFLLWLKSLHRYDSATINKYGTMPHALGILYTLIVNFSSDLIWGPLWAITLSSGMGSIANLILVIWDVPEGAKWFAYCSYAWCYAYSSVVYGWANTILRDSPETRSYTIVFMNMIAQSTTAWTGILCYPTVEAPRFLKGYSLSLSMSVSMIVMVHFLNWFLRRPSKTNEDQASATGARSADEEAAQKRPEEIASPIG